MLELDAAFLMALARSLAQGALVGLGVLVAGWPAGVAAGLWEFPARRALILLIALPLLLPSFLAAIGLSLLWRGLGGLGATVWAFACSGVPLVFFITLAAMRTVTGGQAEAARLYGGEALLFRLALRATLPAGVLAAALAAVLTLADMGPGQIFGWHGAASELLISFSARYDRGQATQQALAIAAVGAAAVWPLVWRIAPTLGTHLLARDVSPLQRRRNSVAGLALGGLLAVLVILPIAGLLRPLLGHPWPMARAWSEVARTAGDSLVYSALAAALAVAAGFAIAGFAARHERWQSAAIIAALGMFGLPPVLMALWFIPFSSQLAVGVVLALRCLPIALLFGLHAFGAMPRSWSEAGRVHGVSRGRLAARVVAPWLARWAYPAALLAALLAAAEIGVVLLLHPPGHGTLPLAIFTVMANAPEALVAALCLLYVGLTALLGMLGCLAHRP